MQKIYVFLEGKEILTVDRKHLLYSINLKVMLTEELKRYKKKLVELKEKIWLWINWKPILESARTDGPK